MCACTVFLGNDLAVCLQGRAVNSVNTVNLCIARSAYCFASTANWAHPQYTVSSRFLKGKIYLRLLISQPIGQH